MKESGHIKVFLLLTMVFLIFLSACNKFSEKSPSAEVKAGSVKPNTNSTDISEKRLKEKSPTVIAEPDIVVSPTGELAQLIDRYEKGWPMTAQEEKGFIELRMKFLELKKNGHTRWGSEKWMKDPNYYKGLNTFALVEECFSGSLFANEMSIYNDPRVGYESLRIFHNGFAELFDREDLWKGILHLYDYLSSKLDTQADLRQIVAASGQFDELRMLYYLSPLREQVKGREGLFLAANLRALKKYKWYMENYNSKKLGTEGSPGFFREPCQVAIVTLMLAKEVDTQKYDKIAPSITSIRWTREQDVKKLKSFIDLVIIRLDGFVSEKDSKQLDEIRSEAAAATSNKI